MDTNDNSKTKSKVVIIGTGMVGMSYAYSLFNQGTVKELVLIDIDKERAEGEAMDLNHGLSYAPRKMKIYAGGYSDCTDADIVVITAGVSQKEGETRIDLLNRNAAIMKIVVGQIMKNDFGGILLVASNPVDILTYVAWKTSGLPSSRVIGSGTSLDTARLRFEIAKKVNISVKNIHAYIMGEHGDSEFVCWSQAYVGAKPLVDMIESLEGIDFKDLEEIHDSVKNAAYEIIKRKKATYYGIGMTLVSITSSILNDENRILPISVYNDGIYDIEKDVYIGLPAVLNAEGVNHVLKLKLNDKEQEQLKHSANLLKEVLNQMEY
ncbi:L-lactate dehydrogenase [Maribacter polysiphoniae]|uniref:L-lactate dehydrogenase n=1 Tax=Maribacter polysiphoniae TaxID=429344 RepID=A0A316ENH6_9FLAO|nr:L-lactate dehydrogenase [Maribacter polysiphoniae]MBD1258977.1 L-lactate dehydrogenase [Maribacter polysiphoniae]PWK24530.1 L-lactate dehydrogenase [Maribacter polysiphoniae]